jgi:hypothetical protein
MTNPEKEIDGKIFFVVDSKPYKEDAQKIANGWRKK